MNDQTRLKRRQVSINDLQWHECARIGAKTGESVAKVIRDAIADYVGKRQRADRTARKGAA